MSKGNLLANRDRRASINNILQLCNSMELIASNRFNKLRSKLDNFRTMKYLASTFVKKYNGSKDLIIAIGSDLSLCGGYNLSVAKILERADIVIGKKLQAILKARNFIFENELNIDEVFEKILSDEIGSITVVYSKYISNKVEVVKEKVFPVANKNRGEKEYDFDEALKIYLDILFKYVFNSSLVSENYLRMVAMKSATTNSEELLEKLKVEYNKERQSLITKDITEIVGAII